MTPEQRSRRASIAANTMHSRGLTNTRPARAAFDKRFLDLVDPDRTLPEQERARRADQARRAHMLRMSEKAAAARRQTGTSSR